MILLREYRGVEYTIETWDLLYVRTVIWMFPLRPHASSSQIWSIIEAEQYCTTYIDGAMYEVKKVANFAKLYGGQPK